MTLSHQSVMNILNIGDDEEITFDVEEISGYIEYDEQFPEINGEKIPKGQLLDAVTICTN